MWSRAFVTTVVAGMGTVLGAGGCDEQGASTSSGPSPTGSGDLLTWKDVKSDHPKGASNPPSPVLVVDEKVTGCAKGFYGGIGGLPDDAFQVVIGGKTYDVRLKKNVKHAGVPIHCPDGAKKAIEQAIAAASAWDDAPVLAPRPKLRRADAKAEAERGVIVHTRRLVKTLTAADPLSFRIWFGSGAPLDPKNGIGAEKLVWAETIHALKVTLEGPDGTTRTVSTSGGAPTDAKALPFAHLSGFTMSVRDDGVSASHDGSVVAWADASGPLFPAPGKYTVRVAGTLGLDAGAVAFETSEIEVVIAEEGTQPLAKIETIAADYVKKRSPKLRDAPRITLPTMDDEEDNRVVRFALSGNGYEVDFVELVLGRDGTVLSVTRDTVHQCIAEGTDVATPSGPRSVESLAVGEAILGFDIANDRPVVTHVQKVWRSYSEDLFRIRDGLVVSGNHPIYADGVWTAARDVHSGAGLLSSAGEHVSAAGGAWQGGAIVYDLAVAWPHTYFAGGVLVHNKAVESKGARRMRTDLDARPSASASK